MYLTNANIEEYLNKTNFQKRINKLAKKYENKKIIIYGASAAFDIIKRKYDLSSLNIIGIADLKFKDGAKHAGYNTYTPHTFLNERPDVVLIAMIESEIAESFFQNVIIPEFGRFEYEPLIIKESFRKKLKSFVKIALSDTKYALSAGKNRVLLPKYKIYPDVKTYIEANPKVNIDYKTIFPEFDDNKEGFVLNIPDGKVWGNDAIVLTHNNYLIENLVIFRGADLTSHPIFDKKIYSNIYNKHYYSENIGSLASIWSNCYYHWVIDLLPKLLLLEKSGIKIHKYVVNNMINKFQYEYLKLLDIPEDKIVKIDNKTLVHAKNLIVPAIPGSMGNAPIWACDYLKEKLTKSADNTKPYPERIFISRNNARGRRILNEEAIFNILARKGFVRIILEEMSLKEQIAAFSNAKVVIAPHGAGLTNLVFSDSETKVLEIFTQNYINDCYENICRKKKNYYYSLICEYLPENNYDIFVDENKFIETLNSMNL